MVRKMARSKKTAEETRESHRRASIEWYYRNQEHAKKRSREWARANPEKAKAADARYHLKKRLAGSSRPCPELCEVCGRKGQRWSAGTLCRDHDHETGKFRGWLCHKCNLALGNVNDNVDVLRGLAIYLESYRALKLVNQP